jgi:protoheme IX farnesyltransferase
MPPATNIADLDSAILEPAAPASASNFAPASPASDSLPQPVLFRAISDFIELSKPRMNFLVLATTLVGFSLTARNAAAWQLLPATLLGTALCAAAAAALNQVWEHRLDSLMPRTRLRPIPTGRISPAAAVFFGLALACAGTASLLLLVNPLTALVGALTIVSYVLLYTPLKRRTTLCTVVGAIPGALPPVMGWTAVHNSLGPGAVALFAILFLWQMPHFLAIAILYKNDYAAGGFRMLPCEDPGLHATSRQIVLFSLALIPATFMPTMLALSGPVYFIAAFTLGLAFLAFSLSAARSRDRRDARNLFLASIVYLPLLLTFLVADRIP